MPVPDIVQKRFAAHQDQLILLRDRTAAAISAAASEAPVQFNPRSQGHYYCWVNHAALPNTTAAIFWTVTVEVDNAQAFANPVEVGSVRLSVNADLTNIPLSGTHITTMDPDSSWIRVTATPAGAAGNLAYGAGLTM